MFLCGCKTAARVACEFGVKSAWSICRRAFVSFIKARMAETSLGPSPMLGDPDLITRLVAHLVDNAVRDDVPGGAVEGSTPPRDGPAVLIVANSGPVIPPGEIGRLMQPFQRLATARSSDRPRDRRRARRRHPGPARRRHACSGQLPGLPSCGDPAGATGRRGQDGRHGIVMVAAAPKCAASPGHGTAAGPWRG